MASWHNNVDRLWHTYVLYSNMLKFLIVRNLEHKALINWEYQIIKIYIDKFDVVYSIEN